MRSAPSAHPLSFNVGFLEYLGQAGILPILGSGDGTFASNRDYLTASEPTAIAIADMNLDQLPDLVVVWSFDGAVCSG
jgi:hypothetical protein